MTAIAELRTEVMSLLQTMSEQIQELNQRSGIAEPHEEPAAEPEQEFIWDSLLLDLPPAPGLLPRFQIACLKVAKRQFSVYIFFPYITSRVK
jgi:hypothetical protein